MNDNAQGNPLEGLTTHSPQWWEAVYRAWAKHAYMGAMVAYRNKSRAADACDVEDVVQEVFAELMDTKGIDDQTTSIPGALYTGQTTVPSTGSAGDRGSATWTPPIDQTRRTPSRQWTRRTSVYA